MLKYTNMFLIKILATLLIFSFSFNKGLNAKTILATYDISWNSIVLGNIYWEFSVFEKSYNFSIKLESSGFSSKLYPFNGTYSSSGIKTAGGSFIPEKYYHFWRGKKKEKLIKIIFSDNKIKNLTSVPEQSDEPFVDFYKLDNPTDPIAAAMDLIINDDEKIAKNIFDGRRIYDLSLVSEGAGRIKHKNEILVTNNYELIIANYKNVWKDHNNKDLKKVNIITGIVDETLTLPLRFKIINKGLVFKINYVGHITKD